MEENAMECFTDVVEKYRDIGLELEVESIGLQECYRLRVNNDREIIVPYEIVNNSNENEKEMLIDYITEFFKSVLEEEEKKKTP